MSQNDSVPLIVAGRPWNPDVVLSCCAKAEALGVEPGMPVARAAMRCPDAAIIPAKHEAYQATHELLIAAQRQYTDQVETVSLGMTFASADGLRRMFDDDSDLAKTWSHAAREVTGLDVRLGLAYHRYTAEQAALAASKNADVVVSEAQEGAFLSALPVTALPAMDDDIRRLRLLGINTLGQLASMPRMALIRQFSAEMGGFHDMASGKDPRGIFPDAPPLELSQAHSFEPAVISQPRLLGRAKTISDALSQQLQKHHYQAQGIRVQINSEAGDVRTSASSMEPPTADPHKLFKRLSYLITKALPRDAISELSVILYPLRPRYLAATQLALFSAPVDYRTKQLFEAIRRLRDRFGEFIVMVASLMGRPQPVPIHVTVDADGFPCSLVVRDSIHLVFDIYEHWREDRMWWENPMQRWYYRVADDAGGVRVIYRDLLTETWWLER